MNVNHGTETPTEYRPLTGSERRALAQLLTPEFGGKAELAYQIDNCRVKTLDEDGSLGFAVAPDSPKIPTKYRVVSEAEWEDGDGTTVHALLHVLGGCVSELEFYRDDGARVVNSMPEDGVRVFAPS